MVRTRRAVATFGTIVAVAVIIAVSERAYSSLRDLLDISEGRPIFETIATRGQGVPQLLDGLLRG